MNEKMDYASAAISSFWQGHFAAQLVAFVAVLIIGLCLCFRTIQVSERQDSLIIGWLPFLIACLTAVILIWIVW